MLRKFLFAAVVCLACSSATLAAIVRIDSRVSGYTPSDPAPLVGETNRTPINPVELSLPAGTYQITNAYAKGLDADPYYRAWTYGAQYNWAWTIFDKNDSNRVLLHVQEDFYRNTADEVAALAVVQNYAGTLTLTAPTTLRFGIRDFGLGDNNGGVSLSIVPEPTAAAFLGGLGGLALTLRRRRR